MSVVVSLQDVGPCRKQLTVEVPAPAVEAETQRVVQEFGKRILHGLWTPGLGAKHPHRHHDERAAGDGRQEERAERQGPGPGTLFLDLIEIAQVHQGVRG